MLIITIKKGTSITASTMLDSGETFVAKVPYDDSLLYIPNHRVAAMALLEKLGSLHTAHSFQGDKLESHTYAWIGEGPNPAEHCYTLKDTVL